MHHFFKSFGENLIELCDTYVDYSLYVFNPAYFQMSRLTKEKFKCKPREWDEVQFAGVQIGKLAN